MLLTLCDTDIISLYRPGLSTRFCIEIMYILYVHIIHACVSSSLAPPKIQVYSRNPGEFGKENTLICHVSDFHPPDITIDLLKNGEVIPNAKQTDLAFEKGWKFHLTKSVSFTPTSSDKFTCRVRHLKDTKNISWGKTDLESVLNKPSRILCYY